MGYNDNGCLHNLPETWRLFVETTDFTWTCGGIQWWCFDSKMPKSALLAHADASIFLPHTHEEPWWLCLCRPLTVSPPATFLHSLSYSASILFFGHTENRLCLLQNSLVQRQEHAVAKWSIWWAYPLVSLRQQFYKALRSQQHCVILCSGLWTPQSGVGSRGPVGTHCSSGCADLDTQGGDAMENP